MKKIYNVMMVAAVAAAALVSCAKEMDKPEVAPQGEGIKVTVITANEVETKTALSGDKSVVWSATDKFGFVNMAVPEDNLATISSIDGSGKATIEGTVATAGTFFAYYPKSTYDPTASGAVLRIKTAQSPTNATTFDPAADVLVSEAFEVSPAGAASVPTAIRFKRLGAFLKVSFKDYTTGTKLTGEYATTVSVQSAGEGMQSLAAKLTIDPSGIVSAVGAEKTITATYADEVFAVSNASQAAYLGVQPVTLPAGSQLIFKVETTHYSIAKTVVLPNDIVLGSGDIQPIQVSVSDAELKTTPALTRVWGWYSEGASLWTNNVTGVSITHPDGYGMARSLALDDNYIYLPKSSAYANIAAVSIANKDSQKALNKSTIAGGSTFVTSFVRVIKNTDPEVNGGKDILLLCNLTSTDSDANQLRLYAYENGVDAAPTKIAGFCWDSANSVNDWRRYGDRFFVTGTWAAGKVYFPSFNANKSVALSISNGARTAVTQIAAGAGNSPEGIKDMTVYPESSALFITNGSVANLVSPTGGKSNGWDEYILTSSSANGIGTWGYNFFSFKGQKYIAYARISGNKAWIEIIKDKGDLLTSLADQEGIMKAPIHSADNLDTEHETGGLADCAVRAYDGYVYVAALTRDGGFILDKLVLE